MVCNVVSDMVPKWNFLSISLNLLLWNRYLDCFTEHSRLRSDRPNHLADLGSNIPNLFGTVCQKQQWKSYSVWKCRWRLNTPKPITSRTNEQTNSLINPLLHNKILE